MMLGSKPNIYYMVTWLFVSPIGLVVSYYVVCANVAECIDNTAFIVSRNLHDPPLKLALWAFTQFHTLNWLKSRHFMPSFMKDARLFLYINVACFQSEAQM